MKPSIPLLLLLIPLWGPDLISPLAAAAAPIAPVSTVYDQAPDLGPHHRRWTVARPGVAAGQSQSSTATYVELQSGLHHRRNGFWLETREAIEVVAHGAAARQGPHQVTFSPSLLTRGGIHLVAPDGKEFRSHVLGLSYYDAATGQSVLLAEVKECLGELLPPNQVVYRDAFTDLLADVRYTYTKAGFEQEVILRERPPSPTEFGLSPDSTRLEVLTEFLDPPEPLKSPRIIRREDDPERRRMMLEPDTMDEDLDFGALKIGPGRAFLLPENRATKPAPPDGFVPVSKRWQKLEGRDFLIEAVEYRELLPFLANLPETAAHASVPSSRLLASRARLLPTPLSLGNTLEFVRLSSWSDNGRGVVLDYHAVLPVTDFTFRRGVTYVVSGDVLLSGTTTLEGGAVVKYKPNTSVILYGPVKSLANEASPAIFTDIDDNSVGVPLGSGQPAGWSALRQLWAFYLPAGTELTHLDFRYAQIALQYDAYPAERTVHALRHSRLERCQTGIVGNGASVQLDQLRVCEVPVPYTSADNSAFAVNGISTDARGRDEPLDGPTLNRTPVRKSAATTSANKAPVLTLASAPLIYVENAPAQNVDASAKLTDDSANLEGGTLTVEFSPNGQAEDRLGFRHQGVGSGQIGVSGATLSYQGKTIGNLAGGEGTTPLVVDFNAVATPLMVQALLRNLTYSNVSENPIALTRTVLVTLSDGDGGTSLPKTRTIQIRPINDVPALSLPGDPVNYSENDPPVILDAEAAVQDVDSPNFDLGWLIADIAVNGHADDRLAIRNQGAGEDQIGLSGTTVTWQGTRIGTFSGGIGLTPLVIRFNSAATPERVQTLARHITYSNVSDFITTAPRKVRMVLNDGDGGVSVAVTKSITITPANDPPVVTLAVPPLIYVENAAPVSLDGAATLADDSANWDGGRLTVAFSANGQDEDRLGIRHWGVGAGQIGVSGANVTYQGKTIGNFAGGLGATPLVIDFNASVTPLIAQALLRNLTYSNASHNPILAARRVQVIVSDGDGGASLPKTRTINITPVNDIPAMSLPSGPVNYTENGPSIILDPETTVQDIDSPNFNLGRLTVDLSLNGHADDRLGIRNEGTGAEQIGLSGKSVTFQGMAIGTWSGGVGFSPLQVLFNSAATPAVVQALARNITYSNVSDFITTAPRTVRMVLNDGDGGVSVAVTKSITITPVNDPPVLTLATPPLSYTENALPISVDGSATLVDDSANFDGGTLIVEFDANGQEEDRLGIRHLGAGSGQIGVAGANVTYQGKVVGSFSGGMGPTPLVVEFNASVTPLIAQALIRNITYANASHNPVLAPRLVRMTVSDGDGGSSLSKTRAIHISPVNDIPVMSLPSGPINYTENDSPAILDAEAKVTDVDSADFNLGRLTVDLMANGTASDRLGIRNQGTEVGQIGLSGTTITHQGTSIGTYSGGVGLAPLVVLFNGAATSARVQALLRNLTFWNVSDVITPQPRTVRIVLNDGDGGVSLPVTKLVNITLVNDPPVITLTTKPLTYLENSAPVLIDDSATVMDPDSADFGGGTLTVDFSANGQAEDRLAVRHQGTGTGQIGISGDKVTFQSGIIGSLSGGTGTTPLMVTLNAASSPAKVQALVRNLTYANVAGNRSIAPRTVRLVLTDGKGGESPPAPRTIHIAPNAALDTDADGLPDSWERYYFGSQASNGHGDWDADGASNLREYNDGTHPGADLNLQVFTPWE